MISKGRWAAAAILPLALAACGGGEQGTYACTDMGLIDGITLGSGGKATATASFGGSSFSHSGTYTVKGDQVSITIEGDTQTFTLAGGTLKDGAGGTCRRK